MKAHRFILVFMLVTSFPVAEAGSAQIADGYDWRLPQEVKMHPSAGYLTWNPNWARKIADRGFHPDGGIHLASILMPVWADMNPAEGEYDWRKLDQQIRFSTKKPGTGYVLAVVGFSKMHPNAFKKRPQRRVVPAWVEKKGKVSYLANGMVAYWEPGCVGQKYFGTFLKALGDRYKKDPKLVAVSMAGLDCYHGEWCWRGYDSGFDAAKVDEILREAEEKTGFNPKTYEAWGRKFIDDYVAAFSPNQRLLAWMNGSDNAIWTPRRKTEYEAPTIALWKYAYAEGCGNRDGAVEVWNRMLFDGFGTRWTDDGYLEVNEDLAPIKENRCWYTENEFYRKEWGDEENALRWFTASMRTLQMRRSWVAVGAELDYLGTLFPGFNRWVELSLGKTAKTSSDAWTWLREGYPKRDKPLKNYERWLFQRDTKPDGVTKPAQKIVVPPRLAKPNRYVFATDYEFHARRTDRANGSNAIYFRADPAFVGEGKGNWELKITFVDTPEARWLVEHSALKGKRKTGAVTNTGTGKLRTATFKLPALRFEQAFRGMDFRIISVGSKDTVIRLVRLVK